MTSFLIVKPLFPVKMWKSSYLMYFPLIWPALGCQISQESKHFHKHCSRCLPLSAGLGPISLRLVNILVYNVLNNYHQRVFQLRPKIFFGDFNQPWIFFTTASFMCVFNSLNDIFNGCILILFFISF